MKELKINYHYLNHCDMNCGFCFGQLNESYDPEAILNTFKNLTKITTSINLAGGEIFTNIDLLYEIVKIGMKERISLSLITNGLILTKKLEHPKVDYILKHVKQIGVSVDSFEKTTNLETGRHAKGETLDLNALLALREIAEKYRTKLKINTVVTQKNLKEKIGQKIAKIKPDIWKILQVVSDDSRVSIKDDEFSEFVNKNKGDIPVKVEQGSDIVKSYIMVNGQGTVYYNRKHIKSLNINTMGSVVKTPQAAEFRKRLNDNGIDIDLYSSRYKNERTPIGFKKAAYQKNLGNLVKEKRPILLLDVESITARPHQMKKRPWLNGVQIHLLYRGIVVNEHMEIVETIEDEVETGVDISHHLEPERTTPYKDFYQKFFKRLWEINPATILASGLDTEKNFLMDCVYYADLNRNEYEFLQTQINHMSDIQTIARKDILQIGTKKHSSRLLLQQLNSIREDLFTYTRNELKDHISSGKISQALLNVYHNQHDEHAILLKRRLEMIGEYCLTDVYDDYELLFSYEMLVRSSVEKPERKTPINEVANAKE